MPMYGSLVTSLTSDRSTALAPLLEDSHLSDESSPSPDALSSSLPESHPMLPPLSRRSVDHDTTVDRAQWQEWLFPDQILHERVGISPNNAVVVWFDRALVVALVLTATVTVFVVCVHMTGTDVENSSEFTVGLRIITDVGMDVIFIADFALGFFRAYREEGGRGRMVFDLREIQKNYVTSPGFAIDLVSSIPYDLLVVIFTSLGAKQQNLRFLRLIRLFRIHRGYRIVNQSPWYHRFSLTADSRMVHMAYLVTGLVLIEHWAACWWVWIGREEIMLDKSRYTWIDRLQENGFIFDRNNDLELYIVALYWASTVSSSVGSGDIVPANPTEAMFVATFQILGGCLFAYAVSSLVGLYAALHANEQGRGYAIDAVNEMLLELTHENADVDAEKIRSFVWQACDARAARARRRLAPGGALAQLSPQLREEVFLAERHPWMERIWFLRGARPRLARAITREAKWVTYAPGDYVTLSSDQGLVITRGVCTTRDHVLVRGSVFGLEGLATCTPDLSSKRKGPSMLCLNFVEALMFDTTSVEKAVKSEASPEEYKKWRRARVRYGLLRWARHVRKRGFVVRMGEGGGIREGDRKMRGRKLGGRKPGGLKLECHRKKASPKANPPRFSIASSLPDVPIEWECRVKNFEKHT